jgi:hypothetical protein
MSLEELSPKQQERYFKYLASLPLEKRLLISAFMRARGCTPLLRH